ncbi:hypothetical protein [Qipengyuania vesicularis]|nr:hypothetical protein [Qipengyuania vesicularis]
MTKAIALARTHVPELPLGEWLRAGLVSGCGLALVLAGPFLPY